MGDYPNSELYFVCRQSSFGSWDWSLSIEWGSANPGGSRYSRQVGRGSTLTHAGARRAGRRAQRHHVRDQKRALAVLVEKWS